MKKNEALPAAELSIFCSQVAMFLEAGMPVYEGIRTMCENSGESGFGPVYARLNEKVEDGVREREKVMKEFLEENIVKPYASKGISIRGIGCMWGIEMNKNAVSKAVLNECFKNGVILERAGRDDSVVKLMPALNIPMDTLMKGMNIVKTAVDTVMATL